MTLGATAARRSASWGVGWPDVIELAGADGLVGAGVLLALDARPEDHLSRTRVPYPCPSAGGTTRRRSAGWSRDGSGGQRSPRGGAVPRGLCALPAAIDDPGGERPATEVGEVPALRRADAARKAAACAAVSLLAGRASRSTGAGTASKTVAAAAAWTAGTAAASGMLHSIIQATPLPTAPTLAPNRGLWMARISIKPRNPIGAWLSSVIDGCMARKRTRRRRASSPPR